MPALACPCFPDPAVEKAEAVTLENGTVADADAEAPPLTIEQIAGSCVDNDAAVQPTRLVYGDSGAAPATIVAAPAARTNVNTLIESSSVSGLQSPSIREIENGRPKTTTMPHAEFHAM
jgi:hypothetical protein